LSGGSWDMKVVPIELKPFLFCLKNDIFICKIFCNFLLILQKNVRNPAILNEDENVISA
jgi:hypothetical protein